MVEIIFKITERDDNIIDINGRGSMVAPYSGYETHIGKALIPLLNEVLLKLKEQFPTKEIRIAEFDSPLNPAKPKEEEPWKFPRRGEII